MSKDEIAKMAKEKGFVPQFISDKESGLFPIPISNQKEDLRYFLHLCEVMYWLSGKSSSDQPGSILAIEYTVTQLLQNKK